MVSQNSRSLQWEPGTRASRLHFGDELFYAILTLPRSEIAKYKNEAEVALLTRES